MTMRDQVHLSGAIVEQVRPILAGHSPEVIGAALADLFATLLAGYFDDRGPEFTFVNLLNEGRGPPPPPSCAEDNGHLDRNSAPADQAAEFRWWPF
jgi:hypothetical protein